jgi:hypothetical protein
MIKISPALLKDLQTVLDQYGYNLKHSAVNDLNKKTEGHRYIFSDGDIKILLEVKNDQ